MKKAVILVSGGIDSSTVLAWISTQGYEIYALSFNYQQKQIVELKKIQQFIKQYEVKEHKIIDINFKSLVGPVENSPNTNIEIPKDYIPARNTIFLSYALGFAEIIGAYDIFIGVHAAPAASSYPDCQLEYIKSFENMANLAIISSTQDNKINIHAPLMNMTKTEIVKLGLKMGVDYFNTISCYNPNIIEESCGKCAACVVRIKAFEENGLQDPISYIK